jgi:SAM-dependent methyltransferase
MNIKYQHRESTHNLKSPSEIVSFVLTFLKPKSVIDVGCGTGTFLKKFKDSGVERILGVDGNWVNRDLLKKNIQETEFVEADLEKQLSINEHFDLAICLEVGEHLHSSAADTLVSNLVKLSDTIIFSAAIPLQGGQNHINEQWPEYWMKKFSDHGYIFYDVFREQFWNNKKVFWWYKQNMFLVRKSAEQQQPFLNYVHPELFYNKAKTLNTIIHGEGRLIIYFVMLAKRILKPFRKSKIRHKF